MEGAMMTMARARWLALVLVLSTALGLAPWSTPAPVGATPDAVFAWGWDEYGQLGDGTVGSPNTRATTAQVVGLTGVTKIAAGVFHSLAVKGDGTVWTWGADSSGQLGDGTVGSPDSSATPAQVPGLANVIAIAGGANHSLALKGDGTVWTWGNDTYGQLGDGTVGSPDFRATPAQVSGLTGITAIAASGTHSLALKNDETVWAWGSDEHGQLGDGTVGSPDLRATPAQVANLSGVTAIAAGGAHSVAVKGDGTVWAWGNDGWGQLGDGTVDNPYARATPAQVTSLTGVTAIGAGFLYTVALKGDGTVWAWGRDQFGELGDGTVGSPEVRATPAQVVGLTGVKAISLDDAHTLALKEDGTVWGWGYDRHGQLGDGTVGNPEVSATPIQAIGISGVAAIAAGGGHSLALAEGAPVSGSTLTVSTVGSGTVGRSPAGTGSGPFSYPVGTTVTLTPLPGSGRTFTGWIVDGVARGWAGSLTLTMDSSHTAQATFAPTTSFPDVGSGRPDRDAIVALTSRGTVRGYADGRFGPDNRVTRAEMAALIARAMPAGSTAPPTTLTPPACTAAGTWDCEVWPNSFTDQGGLDPNLWRDVAALQHYGVTSGYAPADCAARGFPAPCFGPNGTVSHVETIVFIVRAMVAQGYWVLQPAAPQPYPGVSSAFTAQVATYHFYTQAVGGIPAPPANWNDPATRGWFARVLWRALDTYWGTDGLLPDGRPGGGYLP